LVADQEYAYLAPSVVERSAGRVDVAIATSTAGDVDEHPWLFSGIVQRPRAVAQALLVVAEVARTRYYTPPNMLKAILLAADPVVTADGSQLRFESFSPCGGVYARLDIDRDGAGDGFRAYGTTNVDFNPPLRAALGAIGDDEAMQIDVGWDRLRVTTPASEVVERQVRLPDRWVKGFAEVTLATAAMVPYHSLDIVSARRFLRSVPRTQTREPAWATPSGRELRLSGRPTANAVCVAAPERLRLLERMLPLAQELRVFGAVAKAPRGPEPSAWQLRLPDARLTIALSPSYNRGFSGEGALLEAIDAIDSAVVERVDDAIDVGDVDPDTVAAELGIARDVARRALGVLAAHGRVGYDLERSAFFHRELPYDADALAKANPRLRGARALVEKGRIERISETESVVKGSGVEYLVRETVDGWQCTCPWYARHRNSRGPCKHVLAVQADMRARP
jgi:hypothetical protein